MLTKYPCEFIVVADRGVCGESHVHFTIYSACLLSSSNKQGHCRNMKLKLFFLLPFLLPLWALGATLGCGGFIEKGEYLGALNCIGNKDDLYTRSQRSAVLSYVGQEQQAQILLDKDDDKEYVTTELSQATKDIISNAGKYARFDAVNQLAEIARDRRVVMLNEAHDISRHRIFALQLARALRKEGFTHLAVEALSESEKIQKYGYATLTDPISGYYTADPEFAYFLREAISIGYQLVAYEHQGTGGKIEREAGQASNLAKLFADQPNAKVFVYAGYAHIKKTDTENGKGWMAKVFKELTNIDPLTIDQVGGTPSPYVKLNDPIWTAFEDKLGGQSRVFSNDKGKWLASENYRGAVDVTVFHPKAKFTDGRPDWLANNRVKHLVKSAVIGMTRPVIIRATRIDEKSSVPVDQILIDDATHDAVLFLPCGHYMIEKETLINGIAELYELTI
jgi:hypothetical protein